MVYLYHVKGLLTRNTHAQYESPITISQYHKQKSLLIKDKQRLDQHCSLQNIPLERSERPKVEISPPPL